MTSIMTADAQAFTNFLPITITEETAGDATMREDLLDAAFGPARFAKTCQRLRDGHRPAAGLALAAKQGDRLIGTVRLWHVKAGKVPALLLGPLAVDNTYRSLGLGGRLMREAIARAGELGHKAILLVGDAPYYARFGFSRAPAERLVMPGPVELERFLGLELTPGALAAAKGLVKATGALTFSASAQFSTEHRQAA
jgi:predicted N-acetyltransferase YhbS